MLEARFLKRDPFWRGVYNLSGEKRIVVSKDGPYLVSGDIPLTVQTITPNVEGFSWDWK